MARVSKVEIEAIKTHINLIDFIKSQGYLITRSGKNSAEFSDKNKSFKICVNRNNNGHWVYYDFVNNQNEGTIIDFITKYESKSYSESIHYLKSFLEGISVNEPYDQKSNEILSNKINDIPSEEYFKFKTLNYRSKYLHDRGINDSTMFHPIFKNRIGVKEFLSKNNKPYHLVGFPIHQNITGVLTGFIGYSVGGKQFYKNSSKSTSFWRSNATSKNPDFYIFENPVDAMSHFQLKKNPNAFYLSPLGVVKSQNSNQFLILKDYLENRRNQFSSFNLCNDNDKAGICDNINIIGGVNLYEKNPDLNISISSSPQGSFGVLNSPDIYKIDDFTNELNLLNKSLPPTSLNRKNQFREFEIDSKKDNHTFKFTFDHNKDSLQKLQDLVLEKRNSKFKIETSIGKDFSQDLESKLGITREDTIDQNGNKRSFWKKKEHEEFEISF